MPSTVNFAGARAFFIRRKCPMGAGNLERRHAIIVSATPCRNIVSCRFSRKQNSRHPLRSKHAQLGDIDTDILYRTIRADWFQERRGLINTRTSSVCANLRQPNDIHPPRHALKRQGFLRIHGRTVGGLWHDRTPQCTLVSGISKDNKSSVAFGLSLLQTCL